MTYRTVTSFGLTAGISLSEMRRHTPGFIIDMYLLRRKYDDEQHGIKRKREEPEEII